MENRAVNTARTNALAASLIEPEWDALFSQCLCDYRDHIFIDVLLNAFALWLLNLDFFSCKRSNFSWLFMPLRMFCCCHPTQNATNALLCWLRPMLLPPSWIHWHALMAVDVKPALEKPVPVWGMRTAQSCCRPSIIIVASCIVGKEGLQLTFWEVGKTGVEGSWLCKVISDVIWFEGRLRLFYGRLLVIVVDFSVVSRLVSWACNVKFSGI